MQYFPLYFFLFIVASMLIIVAKTGKQEKIKNQKLAEEKEEFFIRVKQAIPQCQSVESVKDSACGASFIINYFDFEGHRKTTAVAKVLL